jgi:hypothetical protein
MSICQYVNMAIWQYGNMSIVNRCVPNQRADITLKVCFISNVFNPVCKLIGHKSECFCPTYSDSIIKYTYYSNWTNLFTVNDGLFYQSESDQNKQESK